MEENEIANEVLCIRAKRIWSASMRHNFWPLFFVGVLFTAIGVFLSVGLLLSFDAKIETVQIIMFSVMGIASLAGGILSTVYSLKRIIPYLRDLRILKKGVTSTARIAGSHSMTVRYSRRDSKTCVRKQRTFYSFDLKFYDNDGEKRCKTQLYYTENHYKYLQKNRTVKIKHLNGHAVIIEDLPL